MARQNIQFKGLRHAPSDITGQDGDLLECVNLVHQNGELKPLEMPERMQMKGVYNNETLVAVHNITGGKKFVYAVYNGVMTYIHIKDENDPDTVIFTRGIPQQEIKWAETVGNTLIIGTDKSTHYALYKNGEYKWLGDKLPQPVFELDVTLRGNSNEQYLNIYSPNPPCEYKDGSNYYPLSGGGVPLFSDLDDTPHVYLNLRYDTEVNRKAIRDNMRSKMAELLNKAKQEGRFIYPFFARYAMRLYDDSHVMHSAPVLLLPSTLSCPIAAYFDVHYGTIGDYEGRYGYFVFKCYAKAMKLTFKGFVNENGVEVDISDWEDIVKGVDMYLSSQIVTFNDRYYDNLDNLPIRWYWSENSTLQYDYSLFPDYGYAYVNNTKESWLNSHKLNGVFPATPSPTPNMCFPLQSISPEQTKQLLQDEHLFYRVKRYDLQQLEEIKNQVKYLNNEIEYGTLQRLETLPTLEDDYVSRSRMVGSASYNYNQRLILGNISLQAPLWYPYTKDYSNYFAYAMFKIEKPEKTIYIYWAGDELGQFDFGHYLYYPDPDCTEVIISNGVTVRVIPMREHSGLNGAYALMPELKSLYEAFSTFPEFVGEYPVPSDDRYYTLSNTIAMSGVANPFYFPASNFKDIGRAKVIGMAANMLDVSSAQWGQYPVYVFCSDGIIAVMIDGEGKMGGIQAVSADVLREPQGLSQPTLVQTGQTLMFLTQRGVMAIAGTKISCVSEAMEGRHFNPIRELADIDYRIGAFQNLITRTSDNTAFVDFAASGFLAYDYAHNRVMLLRSDKDYQYLFDMKTGLWSKQIVYTNLPSCQLEQIPSNTQQDRSNPLLKVKPIHAAVNNYTEMYLQDTDGYLYKTMEVMDENATKQLYQYGYLVSRPIRFGTDEYKTLVRTLHRYTHFANMSFVKMAVYGSRDGVKYGRLNTLRGMSYKYFIFAIYTYMKPNERYSYLSVDFETRLNNKLR